MSLWPFNRACRCADGLSSLRDEAASASSPEASIPHAEEVSAMSPARLLARSLTDCASRDEWVREKSNFASLHYFSVTYRNPTRDLWVTQSYASYGGSQISTQFTLSKCEQKIVAAALDAFNAHKRVESEKAALARLIAPRKGLQRDSGETAKTGSTGTAKARSRSDAPKRNPDTQGRR
jgi:hypothetical protein